MFDFATGSAWRSALNPNQRRAAALNPDPGWPSAQNPNPWYAASLNPNPWAMAAQNPNRWDWAANNPNPRRRAGLNPNQSVALNPNAQAGSVGNALLPPGVAWEQLDPDWVYGDGDGLLAQGLRRSGLQLSSQTRAPGSGATNNPTKQRAEDQLLRWGGKFRVQALLAELSGRFALHEGRLIYLEPGRGSWAEHPVFELAGVDGLTWDVQIDKVLRAAVEREDRLPEILSQRDGFWPYFDAITGLSLERLPRTAELMDLAYLWATMQVMGLKHHHAVLRPHQRSNLVIPAIETPSHGSLPSGHATIATLMASLLIRLLYSADPKKRHWRAQQLDGQARRIAFNRVVAGVHFPIDSHCGRSLGAQLASWLRVLGGADGIKDRGGSVPAPKGLSWSAKPDLVLTEVPDPSDRGVIETDAKLRVKPLPLLAMQWRLVEAELAPLRS